MIFLPFILLIIASVCIGGMAECRKGFQVSNGTGLYTTLIFSVLNSAAATLICLFFIREYSFEFARIAFSAFYSVATVTISSFCLVGSAWGNVTLLIASASLGGLVWPSLFGFIFEPQDNKVTIFKIFGFIFAFICLAILFISPKNNDSKNNKQSKKFIISCFLVFIFQGSALIIFKMINNLFGTTQYFNFMAEYMLLSAVLCCLLAWIINRKAKVKVEYIKILKSKSALFALAYAILFFISEFLSLKCVSMVPLTFQAPMSFCIPIIVTAVLERVIYKTKIDKKEIVQLVSAMIACICFVI